VGVVGRFHDADERPRTRTGVAESAEQLTEGAPGTRDRYLRFQSAPSHFSRLPPTTPQAQNLPVFTATSTIAARRLQQTVQAGKLVADNDFQEISAGGVLGLTRWKSLVRVQCRPQRKPL
jgi:hypothetical protein